MSDELDTVPAEWAQGQTVDPPTGQTSPYAIENILPRGDRRFLQLREPFLLLVSNSPVRAAILECAHFELARQLRSDASGNKRDLEWREEQYTLLTGADPRDCDLWAPFQNELLVSRLCGMASEASTIAGALKWLEDAGLIFRRRMGRNRNDRMVLLNVKQIQRDQRDLPNFSGHRFKPAVSGSPDQLIEEPMETIFTPLYEGLVTVVSKASSKSGISTCRAALVLQRVLKRAELRERAGEPIPAPWSVRDIQSTFGWGSKDTWNAAMNQLIHSGLTLETKAVRRTLTLEPNLIRILALLNGDLQAVSPSIVHIRDSGDPEEGQSYSRTGTGVVQNKDEHNPQQGRRSFLKGSECFSESLTEFLSEREPVEGFKPRAILDSHSIAFFEVRRKTQFVGFPFKAGWDTLSFEDIAEANEEAAAAALLLGRQLRSGERQAIAFPRNTDRAKAFVAVFCGYFIDTHVAEKPITWVDVEEAVGIIGGEFNKRRTAYLERLMSAESPIVIEGIVNSLRHEQVRDCLCEAMKAHSENSMPIIFLGLPDNPAELRRKVKDDRLVDQMIRVLVERVEHLAEPEAGLPPGDAAAEVAEPENPFLG